MFELHSNYTIAGSRSPPPMASFRPTTRSTKRSRSPTGSATDRARLLLVHRDAGRWTDPMGRHAPASSLPRSRESGTGPSASASRRRSATSDARFSADTWTYELRPIIDKQLGPWYVSLNPVLGKSLRGPERRSTLRLHAERRRRIRSHVRLNLASSTTASPGPSNASSRWRSRSTSCSAPSNIDFGPDREFNFGYGTRSRQRTIRVSSRRLAAARRRVRPSDGTEGTRRAFSGIAFV